VGGKNQTEECADGVRGEEIGACQGGATGLTANRGRGEIKIGKKGGEKKKGKGEIDIKNQKTTVKKLRNGSTKLCRKRQEKSRNEEK